MNDWPETSESLILRVKDPADAVAWSAFLAIYRPVVCRLARTRGLQHADADDLAQQVFVSIARAIENWNSVVDGPPFRAWMYRIAHNEILKAITRRKPDLGAGSSSVHEMLHAIPQREAEASVELMRESRIEAFHWASQAIQHEFTAATWAMFWEYSVEAQTVDDVAKNHGRTRGAVYLARYRVMKRLKEKLDEVTDIWSEFS